MASYCTLWLLYDLLSALVACDRLIVCSRLYLLACGVLRASCRYRGISYLLLSFVVTVIRDVPTVATIRAPWVPSGDRQEGGGDFSKRGERLTETRPVPIFMREVKKNVVFQRKTGKIQLETVVFQRKTGENGENLR